MILPSLGNLGSAVGGLEVLITIPRLVPVRDVHQILFGELREVGMWHLTPLALKVVVCLIVVVSLNNLFVDLEVKSVRGM